MSKKVVSKRFRNNCVGILCFIVCMVILNIAYTSLVNITIRSEKNRYSYIAINEANYISSYIDKAVVRTYTIREMLKENDGRTDFFEKVAPAIQESVKSDTGITLRNIAVAPNGIVEKVSPLKTNESLVGFNFTDESKPGNKEAIEAYKKNLTIVTNPFPLIQGGIGMAARTPIYINSGDKSYYWGLVTVTMDFDDVLKSFNFENFTKMHIKYCLWYTDENGKKIILDGTTDEMFDCVSEEVNVFNIKWNLDVYPESGWRDKNLIRLARIVIFIISALISVLLMLVLKVKRDGSLMKILAEQDSLTHCYSRHYLNSHVIDTQTGDWKNKDNNYSVAIIDVDNFKNINDTYGHIVGDRALIAVAEVLKETLNDDKEDKVIRFGGDEYLVFYNDIDRKSLRIKFQDILSLVERIHFDDIPELKLTISAGIAIPEFMEDTSYKEMMKRADENLYSVKQNGRNNYAMR